MRCPLCPMLDEHGICTEADSSREAFWLIVCPLDARRRKIEEIMYDEKEMC